MEVVGVGRSEGVHNFWVKLSENDVYAWVERILIPTVDRTLASVRRSDSIKVHSALRFH